MTRFATTATTLERLRRYYDRLALDYDRWIDHFDRLLLGDGRQSICAQARGNVLEVAVGTGRNFPFYPSDVRLTGVDLSPGMLSVAERRAAALGLTVDLQIGDAQALEFADSIFDTVVFTLALCTIPDAQRALIEAHRVLRPGGRLLLLEHVRSPIGPARWVERLLDPLMTHFAHDHLLRDPLDHLEPLGFRVERCDRTKWGCIEELIARKAESPMGGSINVR